VAQPADRADRGNWWSIYGDARLDALMDRLNASNQTIAQYAAAYAQARALVAEARAAYFPTLGLSAGATRSGQQLSRAGALGSGGGAGIGNAFNVALDASWEPDLWGKVSRTVAAQKAGQQGAAADLANARLSAQATLAQTYFQLRALDAMQRLLDDTVSAYAQALKLTQNQYAQGVAARADVVQAQTQWQSAQASAIDNGVARAQNEHAIAVLIGQSASTFSLPPIPLDAQPPSVPVDVPSALLERRPDIAAAERRTAEANEQIGVAISAYFPSLTLSAQGGYQNSVLSNLFTLPSRSGASARNSQRLCSTRACGARKPKPPAPPTISKWPYIGKRCWAHFRKSRTRSLRNASSPKRSSCSGKPSIRRSRRSLSSRTNTKQAPSLTSAY